MKRMIFVRSFLVLPIVCVMFACENAGFVIQNDDDPNQTLEDTDPLEEKKSASPLLGEIVYIEPYTVNAAKGDIILTGTPGGLIGNTLSASFGGYWPHSGMMIDDGYHIRHNTFDINGLRLNTNWLGVPTSINSYDLEHGLPGLITEKTQWCGSTDVVLKPKDEDESTYRPILEEIADEHIWLRSYYRITSYINPSIDDWLSQFNDGNTLIDHKGTHCSGQLWYANYLMGNEMNVFHAGTDAVDAGAHALYQGLYDSILEQVHQDGGFWGKVFNTLGFINYPDIATKLANQVANAFGLDVYNDTRDTWRNYLGKTETYSVAPDHLIMASMINPNGDNTGIQTDSSSYYGKMENTVKGGGYYLDTGTGLPLEEPIVTIYTDANFNGSNKEYWQPQNVALLPWNDALSSIRVAPGYRATLYKDSQFRGHNWSYYCDNGLIPWNDSASSMKIEECEEPVACIFKDNDFREKPVCYFGEVSDPKLGDDIGNDKVSSVRIFNSNYRMVLYEHENYNGSTVTCLKDTSSLGGFNDKASSVKVMLK